MYGDTHQDVKAIAKLEETVRTTTGRTIAEQLFRGAALQELAKYQEQRGAPEQIAVLLERQLIEMESLSHNRNKAENSAPDFSAVNIGELNFERTQAQLADRLAKYRFTQARTSQSWSERFALIRKAGVAYSSLLFTLADAQDEQMLNAFPTRTELKRVIKECADYQLYAHLPHPPQYVDDEKTVPVF